MQHETNKHKKYKHQPCQMSLTVPVIMGFVVPIVENVGSFALIFFSVYKSDISECTMDSHDCQMSEKCTNTAGSYYCSCKEGFTGNGRVCSGRNPLLRCTDLNQLKGFWDYIYSTASLRRKLLNCVVARNFFLIAKLLR